jgi:hypothetical protein
MIIPGLSRGLLYLSCIISAFDTGAQSIATNLLRTIPLNRPLIFDVRIGKGSLTTFSRYQMDVPQGVVVQELDSKGGTFSFEENKVKIIWVSTPPEPEITVRMKILPLKAPGKGAFIFRYYYVEQEQKHEYECLPLNVRFKDTVLPVLLSAHMHTLASKSPQLLVSTAVDPSRVDTKDPGRLKQQVGQLRRDSQQASMVGEREKKKAEAKIEALKAEEAGIKELPEGDEKNKALADWQASMTQAKDELAIAERVLTLSKTLEGNAAEIERINKKVNPSSYGEDQMAASGKMPPVSIKAAGGLAASAAPVKGTFYKIQVGAFSEDPSLSRFKSLGKVSVEKENATYKVLVGNYTSREEASRKKEELSRQIQGCFIVSYRDGQRQR